MSQATLSAAKALLTDGVALVADQRCACASLRRSRVANLTSLIGPLPADARVQRRGAFLTKWGAWSMTLATAYHKIVPMCEPADPQVCPPRLHPSTSILATTCHLTRFPVFESGHMQYKRLSPTYNWECDDTPQPSEPDGTIYIPTPTRGILLGATCHALLTPTPSRCHVSCPPDPHPLSTPHGTGKIVYDILPIDPARGYCFGPHCAPAARAIDLYRAFLHDFSLFRKLVRHRHPNLHTLRAARCILSRSVVALTPSLARSVVAGSAFDAIDTLPIRRR